MKAAISPRTVPIAVLLVIALLLLVAFFSVNNSSRASMIQGLGTVIWEIQNSFSWPPALPLTAAAVPLMTDPVTGSKVITDAEGKTTFAIWQQEGKNCLFGIRTPKGWTGDYFEDSSCPTGPDDDDGIARLYKELWGRFTQFIADEHVGWISSANLHVQSMIDLGKEYGLELVINVVK